jgi:hypothetical protein
MDWHYHALLNALLQAQSVEELLALAQQHPELLSEEFLTLCAAATRAVSPNEPSSCC